jgi:hypothetical protein
MERSSSDSNKWYLYENDDYGVNGLLDYPSKGALCDYIRSADFLANRISRDMDEAGRSALQDACDSFMADEINEADFCDEVLQNLADYDCEIDSMMIEDFERLCAGHSEFSQEAINMFCHRQGIEPVLQAVVTDEHIVAFQQFFDSAHEHWIG